MSAYLLTPPATEPLTLAEAKQFLRIEHNDDDTVISALIAAARTQVETAARCALIAQTWRFVRDAWPVDGRLALKRGPLLSIAAARVFDAEGDPVVIDPEAFALDKASSAIAAPPWGGDRDDPAAPCWRRLVAQRCARDYSPRSHRRRHVIGDGDDGSQEPCRHQPVGIECADRLRGHRGCAAASKG